MYNRSDEDIYIHSSATRTVGGFPDSFLPSSFDDDESQDNEVEDGQEIWVYVELHVPP